MQSLQTLEELWARKPGHRGYARYARALLREGRTERASQVLVEGLQRWPLDPSAHLLKAEIAQSVGDAAQQKADLEMAARLDSRSPAVLWALASLLAEQQYYQQACHWLERYLLVVPDQPQAKELFATVIAKLQVESSRATSTSGPLVESPADLVEGTFSFQENNDSLPAFSENGASSLPQSPSLPSWSTDSKFDVLATMEMPSFHDQSQGHSQVKDDTPDSLDTQDTAGTPDTETLGILPAALPLPPQVPLSADFPSIELGVESVDDPFRLKINAPPVPEAHLTSQDLSKRMDELFQEEEAAPSATTPVMDVLPPVLEPRSEENNVSVTGEDIADRLDDIFPGSTLPEMPAAVPVASAKPASGDETVHGEDVGRRLDELFGSDDEIPALSPSFPSAEDFDATIQLPTVPESLVDPEELVRTQQVSVKSLGEDSKDESSQGTDTKFEPRALLDELELEADLETATEERKGEVPLNLPPLQEPDSWQPGSLVGSRGSDVDSQLDELFAASSFPKELPPPPAPKPAAPNEAEKDPGATTGFARADVTGADVRDRLDELFGEDSVAPAPDEVVVPLAGVPTVTLAEEYLRQGHKEQALAVYQELLNRDPVNESYRKRLSEIQAMEP